jgi:hypothetical protein
VAAFGAAASPRSAMSFRFRQRRPAPLVTSYTHDPSRVRSAAADRAQRARAERIAVAGSFNRLSSHSLAHACVSTAAVPNRGRPHGGVLSAARRAGARAHLRPLAHGSESDCLPFGFYTRRPPPVVQVLASQGRPAARAPDNAAGSRQRRAHCVVGPDTLREQAALPVVLPYTHDERQLAPRATRGSPRRERQGNAPPLNPRGLRMGRVATDRCSSGEFAAVWIGCAILHTAAIRNSGCERSHVGYPATRDERDRE